MRLSTRNSLKLRSAPPSCLLPRASSPKAERAPQNPALSPQGACDVLGGDPPGQAGHVFSEELDGA